MRYTLIAALLALSACDSEPDHENLRAAYHRAEVVRVCADGTYIGRDPKTGRYLTARSSWADVTGAWIAAGVTPDAVCASR